MGKTTILIKSTIALYACPSYSFFPSHFIFSGTGFASLSVMAAFVCMDALPDVVPFLAALKGKKKRRYEINFYISYGRAEAKDFCVLLSLNVMTCDTDSVRHVLLFVLVNCFGGVPILDKVCRRVPFMMFSFLFF